MRRAHLVVMVGLSLVAGCAVMEQENRRTVNLLDAQVSPSPGAASWVLAPIALPVAVGALAVDAVVVHPVTVFDDAWDDTVDVLWTPRDESSFRRAVMAPLAALATPFVFLGDWAGRACFAVPARGEETKR